MKNPVFDVTEGAKPWKKQIDPLFHVGYDGIAKDADVMSGHYQVGLRPSDFIIGEESKNYYL